MPRLQIDCESERVSLLHPGYSTEGGARSFGGYRPELYAGAAAMYGLLLREAGGEGGRLLWFVGLFADGDIVRM